VIIINVLYKILFSDQIFKSHISGSVVFYVKVLSEIIFWEKDIINEFKVA